jgi:hypothetical protein
MWNRGIATMSTQALSEPQPEPDLTLDPDLPSPADVPRVEDLPGSADTVSDPIALAALLTGAADLNIVAASLIGAGAPAEQVAAAVERTEGYSRLVTDLLIAVDSLLAGDPDGRSELHAVNGRLAGLEQGRD